MQKIIVPILLLFSMGATAGEYLIAGVGQINGTLDAPSLGASATYSSIAFEIAAGHQFNKNIAIEAVYIEHGSEKMVGGSVSGHSAGIYAIATTSMCGACFGNDWSVFGKVGVANTLFELKPAEGYAISAPASQSKTAPAFALGLEVADRAYKPKIMRMTVYRTLGGDDTMSEVFTVVMVSGGVVF